MQPRFSDFDIVSATTLELITELRKRRYELESERDKFVRPALQNHIAAVEHMIAIHNARATARMDGIPEERLLAIEATLAHDDTSTVPREVVAELCAEVRRLQGENAMLLPRFAPDHGIPDAAEDFDDEPARKVDSTCKPGDHKFVLGQDRCKCGKYPFGTVYFGQPADDDGNRALSTEEREAREHVEQLDRDAADEFERMLSDAGATVKRRA